MTDEKKQTWQEVCGDMTVCYSDARNWDLNFKSVADVAQLVLDGAPIHEAILGPCRPYFDFELDFDNEEEFKRRHVHHLSECIATLNAIYNKSKARIFTFDSSGWHAEKKMWRVSFHFNISNVGYYTSGFALLSTGKVPKSPGWDQGIYKRVELRQNMRIFGSPKNDGSRPIKVMIKGETYTIAQLQKTKMLSTFIPFAFAQFVATEDLIKEALEAPLVEVKAEAFGSSNRVFTVEMIRELAQVAEAWALDWDVYDTWTKWGWMLANIELEYSVDCRALFHELSALSPKYKMVETDKIYDKTANRNKRLTLGTLRYIAKDKNNAQYEAWRAKYHC